MASCPHLGQVTVVSTNTRVFVSGQPVATTSDTFTVAGCTFTVPPSKPQPCVSVKWVGAARVTVNGQPVVLQTSTGMCSSAEQIIQGPAKVDSTQTRVIGQ